MCTLITNGLNIKEHQQSVLPVSWAGGHFDFPAAHWPLEHSVDKNPLALWCRFTFQKPGCLDVFCLKYNLGEGSWVVNGYPLGISSISK